MRDFSKSRSVPNTRHNMCSLVILNKYIITTHDDMDVGARATQEQLPVGRLSPCPTGAWVENDYRVMIHNQGITIN